MPAPWSVYQWPVVFWQAKTTHALEFIHIGTRVTRGGPHEPWGGQTLWCEKKPRPEAGFLWDWMEICEGVLALADPMGIVTNVRLLDDDGTVLTCQESALFINDIVHELPWQQAVVRSMRNG
jgi:hypothetical protein